MNPRFFFPPPLPRAGLRAAPMLEPMTDKPSPPTLRRVLGLPMLVFYGVGVTIGAGIFALIGEIVRVEARMGERSQPGDWWRGSRSISGGIRNSAVASALMSSGRGIVPWTGN